MKSIDLEAGGQKRIKVICLSLVLVLVLIIGCSCVVYAAGSSQGSRLPQSDGSKSYSATDYGKPDLTIESFGWEPTTPNTRDEVAITVVCANKGISSTVKGFTLYLYVDDHQISSKYLKPLSAGSSESVSVSWKVDESILGGRHTFFAYVNQDKGGDKKYIEESDYSNNLRSETFFVNRLLPDLRLDRISWSPSEINNLDSVTFTVSYSNVGDVSTYKGTAVWLYVDNDFVNRVPIGVLAQGETGSAAIPWTVPRDFKGGEHNVTAYIDRDQDNHNYNNIIKEENEQNNMISNTFLTHRTESSTDLTVKVKDIRDSHPIESAEVSVDGMNKGYTDTRGELTFKVVEGRDATIVVKHSEYLMRPTKKNVPYDSKPLSVPIFLEYGMTTVTLSVKSESGEIIKNAEVLVNGDQTGFTDINGNFNFEAEKDSGVSVKINKLGYGSLGPVDISVGKDGARQLITLHAVQKPEVSFRSTNSVSQVGNQTIFILGALNPIKSPEVTVQLVVAPPSGVSVDETYFVKSGGAFYHNTEPIAPGRESKIVLGMVGNEVGDYYIPANVYYYYTNQAEDKVSELNTTLSLRVVGPTTSSTPSKSWLPGFEATSSFFAMVIAVSIVALKKKQT